MSTTALVLSVFAMLVGVVIILNGILSLPEENRFNAKDVGPNENKWVEVRSNARVLNPQREKMAESISTLDLDNIDDWYFRNDYPDKDSKLKEIWRRLEQNKRYMWSRTYQIGEEPSAYEKDIIKAINTKINEIETRLEGEEDLKAFYNRIDDL